MSVTLANKVSFEFLPGVSFDASTLGVNHTTPVPMRHSIGPLAAIMYKKASFKVFNDSDAAIEVSLNGISTISTVNLAAGASSSVEIDIGSVNGSEQLSIEVNVTAAGTGNGQVYARLDIEQPIVVSGC